jgi:hypothetical protein
MCKPASFVLTKDRVFWSMYTDSHTEIIDEFGLHEDGARGPNVVKVEISPDNERLDSDPGMWVYKLDQDRTPEWYDAGNCVRRARAALIEWVAARVITEGNLELSRVYAFVYGRAAVTLHDTSRATLCEKASANLLGNAKATLRENAWAGLFGNATAILSGNAQATLYNYASVSLCDNATATLHDTSRARLFGNASATLSGNSTATLCGDSNATLSGNSTATLRGDSTATLYENATATLFGNATAVRMSPRAVVIDRRGSVVSVEHGDFD